MLAIVHGMLLVDLHAVLFLWQPIDVSKVLDRGAEKDCTTETLDQRFQRFRTKLSDVPDGAYG